MKAGDLLNQLKTIKVVRCDEVQIRILGLSLANYNVLICAALAAIGAWGVKAGGVAVSGETPVAKGFLRPCRRLQTAAGFPRWLGVFDFSA